MDLIEDKKRRYFHITLLENLQSIKSDGLIPQIGHFSKLAKEQTNSIYLFSSFNNMQNALYNWLGEQYEKYCEEMQLSFEELKLLICVVDLPDFIEIEGDEDFYEICVAKTIPPNYISFYSENYEKIT